MTYWILGLVIFWGIVFILDSISHRQDKGITPKQWDEMQREWKREKEEEKFEDDIFDALIEHQIEEQKEKMNSDKLTVPENPFSSKVFSVQIVSHKNFPNNPLIAPFYDANGNWKINKDSKPLGMLRFEQQYRYLKESNITSEKRVAFLYGAIESLHSIVNNNQLKDGSEVAGKIILKESLEPLWNGHKPSLDESGKELGFSIENKFYPLYRQFIFTENLELVDVVVTDVEARNYANTHFIYFDDDLPF